MTTRIEQLIADAEAKAATFEVASDKGLAAGYHPVQEWGWTAPSIGQGRERIPLRYEYGAWLFGVAQKDLPPGSWRYNQVVGEGPGSAYITSLR